MLMVRRFFAAGAAGLALRSVGGKPPEVAASQPVSRPVYRPGSPGGGDRTGVPSTLCALDLIWVWVKIEPPGDRRF